jgi:transcriptional regulator
VTLVSHVADTVGGVYRPAAFAEDDPAAIVGLARSAKFGHVTVVDDGRLSSTPMPFLISDDGSVVRGHLARPNPVWRSAPCQSLLIVPVTDTYVSPSWYPSKAEHGKVVPTWNYEVVHAHGELVAYDDPVWVEQLVRELTVDNESGLAQPWSVDDAPPDYIAQMVRGIVGVELLVDSLVGKRKLSQNRSAADTAGIVAGLNSTHGRGAANIADAMRVTSE